MLFLKFIANSNNLIIENVMNTEIKILKPLDFKIGVELP